MSTDAERWDDVYAHGDTSRSWYQPRPLPSLRMLDRCGISPADGLVDVGGGASTLVDALLERGYTDLTVLDISDVGLRTARRRLGPAADRVRWLARDLLDWQPERTYRVWHDRAVLHFLTAERDRERYLRVLHRASEPGTVAIVATFAPDGPSQCSGLPVTRYDADDLARLLGEPWSAIAGDREEHTTPGGLLQPFTWAAFRRVGGVRT